MMFVEQFSIRGIRCFEHVTLGFERPRDPDGSRRGGWYVILGENGTGKSTGLKALALTLVGPVHANRLGLNTRTWPRAPGNGDQAGMEARVALDADDPVSRQAQSSGAVGCGLRLKGASFEPSDNWASLSEGLWSDAVGGHFAAAYGPFRRISSEYAKRRPEEVKESRIASLFMEDLDFQDSLSWLDSLPRTPSDASPRRGAAAGLGFQEIADLLNAELLGSPDGERWAKIVAGTGSDDAVAAIPRHATDGSARGVPPPHRRLGVWDLGDGVRSVLAMVVDLLRQLDVAFPAGEREEEPRLARLRRASGVVIIDEPDAHIHPSWQRTLGFTLRRLFPNLQFIVSTHSPFICQAAELGGISLLQRQPGGAVTVSTDIRTVYGWQAGQILTDLFGLDSTRDPDTEMLIDEYDRLTADHLAARGTPESDQRRAELALALRERLGPAGDTPEERALFQTMKGYVQRRTRGRGDELDGEA